MTRYRIPVPAFVHTYVAQTTRRTAERVVIRFHRWLLAHDLDVAVVTGKEVQAFCARPAGSKVAQLTRNDYRYEVRRYLRWLEQKGLAGPFEPYELEGYHRRPLPAPVRSFLKFLAPTRKPATVKLYQGVLRRFHEWLARRGIPIERVDRSVMPRLGSAPPRSGHPSRHAGGHARLAAEVPRMAVGGGDAGRAWPGAAPLE
jgi:site-specific recombinase XerD